MGLNGLGQPPLWPLSTLCPWVQESHYGAFSPWLTCIMEDLSCPRILQSGFQPLCWICLLFSFQACLAITGLRLSPFTFTRADSGLDLWMDSLAWPWACLIATSLPDELDSWLNLASISWPASVALLRRWG